MGSSLVSAMLLDRLTGSVREASARSLQMGYRTSILRENLEWEREHGGKHFPTPRWVVLSATFGLADDPETIVEHPQLARALGVEVGETQHAAVVRDEVLAVRGSKAMLADGDDGARKGVDHDRWSSGSFFTNPLLTYEDAQRLPEQAPRFPAHGGIKTSAAWLIEHAGFSRGFGEHGPASRATLSSRHTLAITNRGNATSADLIELARTVRRGVHDRFGIALEPETVLVGVSL
jgi:UDP-N-acetylmuramate dehydrogenase